ncbi:MAG: sodium:solute symporter family protein [Armatimonadota bacterium]|jgi:SSS family solute:Na+ symporter
MSGFLPVAVLLGAYTLIVLVIGGVARVRAREDTEEDYFVAGRTFNLFVLFFTYEASLFSMWFFLGSGGFWLNHGVWFYCHVLWLVMSGLLLWWLGTRIWLCGKKWNFVTPADLLAHRYGSEVYRVIVALITMGFIFPYILMQIKGGGLALAFTTHAVGQGIPFWQGAGLMALLVVTYTMVGGARAVAWTDAVQGALFLSIIWVIGVGAVMKLGGGVQNTFDTLVQESREHLTLPSPASGWSHPQWTSWWFVLGITLGNAGVWMRIYSAKSPTTLRQTGALIPLAGILAYLATFLYAAAGIPHWEQLSGEFQSISGAAPQPDQLLPVMLVSFWPIMMLPMIVGCFAAGMSTADAQLLAASAICTSDIYKRYISRRASQKHLVWVGRIFVLLFTLAAYAVCLVEKGAMLVQLGALCYAGTANLAMPLIGAFFWQRATAKGAIAGTAAGALSLLFLSPITNPWGGGYGLPLHPGFPALVVNAVLFVVVSLVTKHGKRERHVEYAAFMAEAYGGDTTGGRPEATP